MSQGTKKVLWILFVAFLVVAIFTRPRTTGNAVADVFGLAIEGIESLFIFFGAIADRIPA